jgi:hypothetical protein
MSANGGLIHPLSSVRRWRAATQSNGKCPQDLKREAAAAWRRSGCATMAGGAQRSRVHGDDDADAIATKIAAAARST